MSVKKIRTVLPFAAVFALLMLSVITAWKIHSKPGDVFPVNTVPDKSGTVYTVRVFESISSVMLIDRDNHARKKKIPDSDYSYDPATTRMTFREPFPFATTVVHVEGKAPQPESFCLYNFAGSTDTLLVLLKDREAMEGYEYTYDDQKHMLTFRSDIHPEHDGNFHIMYADADGAFHGFGNWSRNTDRLAELQSQWMQRTTGMLPIIMKDRSGIPNRRLAKEAGFSVRLPKGDATYLSETMEGMEKSVSVLRSYDGAGLMVECKKTPFPPAKDGKAVTAETVPLGKQEVQRQHVPGTESTPDGTQRPVSLTVYTWNSGGTYYQLSCTEDKTAAAEKLLSKL